MNNRARYGILYFSVFEHHMDEFAPVVNLLAEK